MNLKFVQKTALLFLPFAFVISAFSLTSYTIVQQNFRQSADDPQIQMAEDAASLLNQGYTAREVIPQGFTTDISKSLAPYMIIFNNSGKPIASSATLDNTTPTIPSGVFRFVNSQGEDRFTWEPQNAIRSAVVVTKFKNGYVLTGRSIREIEIREDDLGHMILISWLGTLAGTAIILVFCIMIKKKFTPSHL